MHHFYGHLPDSKNVGVGKNFTAKQKSEIIKENMKRNNGVVRSDLSGKKLVKPEKSTKGVTPSPNEWQIDHIKPKREGGSNSYKNILENTIIASVSHAIMVSTYPELNYEHSWDGINYNYNDGEGTRMTISFEENYCVGGICNFNYPYIKDLNKYLEGVPKDIKDTFIDETSQYLLEEIDGKTIPVLTTMFWFKKDKINFVGKYEDFLMNGGNILEEFSIEKQKYFEKCEEYYEMNFNQISLLKSIVEKKFRNIKHDIYLSPKEVKMIGGNKKNLYESQESFKELDIYIDL